MSSEIKLTKCLIICVIVLLIIAVLINLNIERQFMVLDSPLVSNNLALTLIGGVITGITAVVIEKFYRYRMTRKFLQKFLWDRAVMLYGEIYHTHRTIENLIGDKNIFLQKQMFSHQVQKIQNLAFEMVNVDYHLFMRDNLMDVHESFKSNGYYNIFNFLSVAFTYLDISIMNFEFAKNQYKVSSLMNKMYKPADTTYAEKYRIYYVLKVLNQKLISYLDLVEPYMKAIQRDDSENYNWDALKIKILIPCSASLDKFLEENLVIKSNGDEL